jgi:hypothetical protein
MDNRIRNLMGLEDGKREYRHIDGEVDRQTFEFHALHAEVLFSEKGYIATLGPTWNMIHDPRFAAIERLSVKERKGQFGMIRQGIQQQDEAGQFHSTAEQARFLAELLGEGRYGVRYLRSQLYQWAFPKAFPGRSFGTPPSKTYEVGLWQFSQLTPEEQQQVLVQAEECKKGFTPQTAKDWVDSAKWDFIREIAPNCFHKNDKPNDHAQFLFDTISLDLLGLVDDYCEVANLQEWVVVDSDFQLATEEEMDAGENVVFAEVEMLERALTIRANLRVAAAQVLSNLGIDKQLGPDGVELTDYEKDLLLQMIYKSKWPEEKPQLISDVLGFLFCIAAHTDLETRLAVELGSLKQASQAHVAGLRDGSIEPINRVTDGVAEDTNTPEQLLLDAIARDPIKQDLFVRLITVEKELAELTDRALAFMADCDALYQVQERIKKLQIMQSLLAPCFESIDQVITEEAAGKLVEQVVFLNPSQLPVSVGYDDLHR